MLGKCSGHFLLQSFLLSCFSRFCALDNGLDHSGALFCLSTLPIPRPPAIGLFILNYFVVSGIKFYFFCVYEYCVCTYIFIYMHICAQYECPLPTETREAARSPGTGGCELLWCAGNRTEVHYKSSQCSEPLRRLLSPPVSSFDPSFIPLCQVCWEAQQKHLISVTGFYF